MTKTLSVPKAVAAVAVAALLAASSAQADDLQTLSAPPPAWLTDELQREIVENGSAPVPEDLAPRVLGTDIRPGTFMLHPRLCTMNFVFRHKHSAGPEGALPGMYAMGTAGHCVDFEGQRVFVLISNFTDPGVPPQFSAGVYLGDVLKLMDSGPGSDFALVSVRPSVEFLLSPAKRETGGPCDEHDGATPQPVIYDGFGLGSNRPGVLTAWEPSGVFRFIGAAAPGDSGGPVYGALDDQLLPAVGAMTHLRIAVGETHTVVGTHIARILDFANSWELVTDPECPVLP